MPKFLKGIRYNFKNRRVYDQILKKLEGKNGKFKDQGAKHKTHFT